MKIELKKWELTDQDKEGLQRVSNGVDRKFLSNRLPYPYTKENATWWINFTQEADGKNGIYRAIIVDGQYVGNISAEKKEDVYCKDAEIGYLFVFLSLAFGMALLCSLLRLFCPVFQNGIGNLLLL